MLASVILYDRFNCRVTLLRWQCSTAGMRIRMDVFDLIKATIVCGLVAFLCYTFPSLGTGIIIGFLSLVWLSYARKVVIKLKQR